MTVSEAAEQISVLVNSVYRLLDKLQVYGMVVELATSPLKYQALPPKAAIEAYSRYQSEALSSSKLQALASLNKHIPQDETLINFISGQNQFFDKFVELSHFAKQEILVISIGEPVPDEIKLSTRDALARNVECKFMFHKYDKNNQSLLSSWVAMGVEVSHYPDSGFHLLIFDSQKAVLVASNPKETTERTGMVITSPELTKALRDFFYMRWEKAIPIKR